MRIVEGDYLVIDISNSYNIRSLSVSSISTIREMDSSSCARVIFPSIFVETEHLFFFCIVLLFKEKGNYLNTRKCRQIFSDFDEGW